MADASMSAFCDIAAKRSSELAQEAGRREQSKAANRRAILDAGRRVFATLGFEAATVRDIIRGTALASGTFYNYFRSKEEVFAALQDDCAARIRPLLREQSARARTFDEFIGGAMESYFLFLLEEREAAGGAEQGEPIVHIDTPEMAALFDEVRDSIEAAIAGGAAPKVDAHLLAAAAFGMTREIGQRATFRTREEALSLSAFCSQMLLGGVAAVAQTAA